MQAVVLAAGRGKRLKDLTEDLPKVMMPLNGKPIIEIILKQLSMADVKEAVIVVNYKKEKIIEYLGEEIFGIKLKYAEQKETNGTATAVLSAEPYITEKRFFTVAGDSVFPTDILERLKKHKSEGVLSVCRVNDASRFGVIETTNGKVKRIVEKSPNPPSNLANTSIYLFPYSIFDACKRIKLSERGEYEITDAIQLLIDEGKTFEYEIFDCWLDIGTKQQLDQAQVLTKEVHEDYH